MSRAPFKPLPDAPAPLRITVSRQVRFEEVDPLGVAWHGRYPSYLEDGRVALGDAWSMGYLEFHAHGVATPIKTMTIDYKLPLRFKDRFTVEALWHWTEAARLNFEFILRNEAGEITTTASTVQLLVDSRGELLMVQPDFCKAFFARWKRGELQQS